MCNPVAAMMGASLAVTTVGAVAQHQAQSSAADAQRDYQERLMEERQAQIEENYRRTIEAYNIKTQGELAKLEETQQAARAEAFDIDRDALRSQASTLSQAASMGASGQSLYIGLIASLAQAGFDVSRLGLNVGLERRQTERNLEGYRAEARNRASSIQPYVPSPVSSPTGVGAALTIAGGALDAYNTFQRPQSRAAQLTSSGDPRVTPISSRGRLTT